MGCTPIGDTNLPTGKWGFDLGRCLVIAFFMLQKELKNLGDAGLIWSVFVRWHPSSSQLSFKELQPALASVVHKVSCSIGSAKWNITPSLTLPSFLPKKRWSFPLKSPLGDLLKRLHGHWGVCTCYT
jgi:hypothetical protein